MNWQPIETAPKDGTVIIIYDTEWGVYAAEWSPSWYGDTTNQGWIEARFDEEYGSYAKNATLWMPLPEPPTGE
jgi:hypothetical protein